MEALGALRPLGAAPRVTVSPAATVPPHLLVPHHQRIILKIPFVVFPLLGRNAGAIGCSCGAASRIICVARNKSSTFTSIESTYHGRIPNITNCVLIYHTKK